MTSHILGCHLSIDSHELSALLRALEGGLLVESHSTWPFDEYDIHHATYQVSGGRLDEYVMASIHKYLSPVMKATHHIITRVIILPRSGHFTDVSHLDLAILVSLIDSEAPRLHLSYLLLNHIIGTEKRVHTRLQ